MKRIDVIVKAIDTVPAVLPHLGTRARYVYHAFKGGEGSGNFGHAGRPGEVGGSGGGGGSSGGGGISSIETESTGSYSGQSNYIMKGYTSNGSIAATLEYSVYQGVPHIDMVESQQRGIGAGAELVRNLASEYGYENISWGMMTEDGYRLQGKLDKEYNVSREFVTYNAEDITNNFRGTSYSDNPKDFNASFSKDDYSNVVEQLQRIGSENIEVDIADNEVFITATLPEDREVVTKKQSTKTFDYMLSAIEGLVRGVYSGLVGGDFIDTMANLISGQLTQAYQQAYQDEGYVDALPDYLTASLETMILNQYNFVDQFFRDIIDARIDRTSIDPLLVRAQMWANQWNAAYKEAQMLIRIQGGGNLEWKQGATEHGCTTCSNLDGIVMSAKEWEMLGVHPRGYPNSKLECEGGGPANNCDCTLEPTDKRRSPNAYGRVEEIVL